MDIQFTKKPDDPDGRIILADGKEVGSLSRPKFAPRNRPGWFIELDGVTWPTAAGARYATEAGQEAPKAYANSLDRAKAKIVEALKRGQR